MVEAQPQQPKHHKFRFPRPFYRSLEQIKKFFTEANQDVNYFLAIPSDASETERNIRSRIINDMIFPPNNH